MERPPRIDDAGDDAVARPWSARSLVPLSAAALFFLLGLSGLTGLLPFADSSFAPSATPAPGALGRNPQPLATQVGATVAVSAFDFQPIVDILRPAYVLPTVAATPTQEASVFSVGAGAVREVAAQPPTATPTPVPAATATPTNTPLPNPTSTPEPTATPTEAPFAPQPAAGPWNPSKPEVALYDPNPVATVAPDGEFSGYQTLPPPQEQESEE
jgi:hypothetical protein